MRSALALQTQPRHLHPTPTREVGSLGAPSEGVPFPGPAPQNPRRAPSRPATGSSSAGGGFCSREGRSCALGRHQLLSAARSHPAREPAAGPLRGPGSDWRAVGPRQGRAGSRAALLDGPGCPQSAAALLARGPKTRGLWGRLSFEKPLAVPPTTSVYPATALSRTADLRPPVTPASSARKRPQPAPPSPGAEPEPQGVSRRQPESPRAEAPPVGAPGAFPASEGACPARPGTGGETEAEEVPTRCGMGLHGMGVGRGERCFQGPLPSCGPSRVTPRPGKPDSNASPARDVDLLGQGSLIGDAKACPAPYPRRARMAAPGLGAHKDLGRGGLEYPPA